MTDQIVMTPAGWTFMIIAWTVIGGLTLWCFYRLLSGPRSETSEDGKPPPPSGSDD